MPARRRCAFCSKPLPKNARPNRKFCDADCRAGRTAEPAVELGPVAAETERSIAAAGDILTDHDKGAVATLRFLARKIDTEAELRDLALKAASEDGAKPPPVDNVSIPTYLKFCESLGLTPAGRAKLAAAKKPEGGKSGSKLGRLSSVPKPA